jgi:hypothetical protein
MGGPSRANFAEKDERIASITHLSVRIASPTVSHSWREKNAPQGYFIDDAPLSKRGLWRMQN